MTKTDIVDEARSSSFIATLILLILTAALMGVWIFTHHRENGYSPDSNHAILKWAIVTYVFVVWAIHAISNASWMQGLSLLRKFISDMCAPDMVVVKVRTDAQELLRTFETWKALLPPDGKHRHSPDPETFARVSRQYESSLKEFERTRLLAIRLGYMLPETVDECAEMQTIGEKAATAERLK